MEFPFRFDKARAALLYLASRNLPEFTKGKACKLIFLTDKQHLVRYARPTTGDWYAAMEHGPVPSKLLAFLDEVEGTPTSREGAELSELVELDRSFRYPRLKAKGCPDLSPLSESDIECLDAVVAAFGKMTFSQLRGITHETPAYEKAWRARDSNRGVMNFEDFFEEDAEALAGTQEDMLENDALRKAFPDPAWF